MESRFKEHSEFGKFNTLQSLIEERLDIWKDIKGDVGLEERNQAYQEIINIYSFAYLNSLLERSNRSYEFPIPTNDTGSRELQIFQHFHDQIYCSLIFGSKALEKPLDYNPNPQDLFLANHTVYVRSHVVFDFASPSTLGIYPQIKPLDLATSFSPYVFDAFNKKMEDESFSQRVRKVESKTELEGIHGVTEIGMDFIGREIDKPAEVRQYMDLLTASFRVLNQSDPLFYANFQLGIRTLFVRGAVSGLDILKGTSHKFIDNRNASW